MPASSAAPPASGWRIAAAGLLALGVAMGIGRFAFTPLLPMMLHDGLIDLDRGGWLATANYLGYFVGALSCMAIRVDPARMIRLGLGLTVVLTLAMGIAPPGVPAFPYWIALRAASGVASAWVFVFASSWCLLRLAERNAARLGGVIYCGPGIGIFVTGAAAGAAAAADWRAAGGWLLFGALAALLSGLVWRTFRGAAAVQHAAGPAPAPERPPRHSAESRVLTAAYGLAGFGYIITATFLPVIARAALPDSGWADFFWPWFGVCVALGAWLAVFISVERDQRPLLGVCYTMQAAGVLLSVAWPAPLGFALSSLLLGLPFTAITLFAMREARRLALAMRVPANRLMGLLTASYGLGQIVGPPLATRLVQHSGSFTPSLLVAAATLAFGAAVFFLMPRHLPLVCIRPGAE